MKNVLLLALFGSFDSLQFNSGLVKICVNKYIC